ncbi:MAG: hypothetical protein LBJ01_00515, partial [Tannerella sp.]|nr:hypothetical protein [Tannerella sp.]
MLEPVDIAFRINDGELEIQSRRAVNAILGVGEAGSETEQGVSGLERKLKGLLAGFAGTAAIGNFIRQVVNVRAEMQALEQSFAVLLGSEEKAVAMLADLKQFEIESPLDTKAVAQG